MRWLRHMRCTNACFPSCMRATSWLQGQLAGGYAWFAGRGMTVRRRRESTRKTERWPQRGHWPSRLSRFPLRPDEATGLSHDHRGMLIDDRQIDPDVPHTQQVFPHQRGMVVQAMIKPAVALALHRMSVDVLRDVVIDAVIKTQLSSGWRSRYKDSWRVIRILSSSSWYAGSSSRSQKLTLSSSS